MEINPESLDVAARYKLLIGCVVPRPIAFVSTVAPDGKLNLAPFSFFNGVGSNPLTLLFCPSNKPDGTEKDTLRNCEAPPIGIGQFVINVVSEPFVRAAVSTSEDLAYGESEFELSGLTPAPSSVVSPPRVLESPVAFECETTEIVRLNPGAPGGGNVVLGRVVHIFVRDDIINDRHHIDPEKLAAVGRMAGITYCTTRDRFEVPFGKAALES